MQKKYVSLVALVILFCCYSFSYSQILGPSTVGPNSTYTYTFDNGSFIQSPKWIVVKGTAGAKWSSGTTLYFTITWGTASGGSITLQDVNGLLATKDITILTCTTTIPTAPTVTNAGRCGPGTVTLSATYSPGYVLRWYDPVNTTQILFNGDDQYFTTPSLSTTTTYKVSKYQSSTGCESTKVNATATISSPATATAGSDNTGSTTCGLTTVVLAGNTIPPNIGTGAWSVVSGTGGSFSNTANPTSNFTGVAGSLYTLRWTVTGIYGCVSSDDVNIRFNTYPPAAAAGSDNIGSATCGLTGITLQATPVSPSIGTGAWSVVSGTGGSFTNSASPTSIFSGVAGSSYTLRWTVTSPYGCKSTDDVNIKFNIKPTAAAGNDNLGSATCGLTTVALQGNTITPNTGAWSLVSGTGGTITTSSNPTSPFKGVAGNSYTLRWTVTGTNGCVSTDEVAIKFNIKPTAAASAQSIFSEDSTSVVITNPNNVSGTTFTWTASTSNVSNAANGSGTLISQRLTTALSSGSVIYTIVPASPTCTGSSTPVTVTVYHKVVISSTNPRIALGKPAVLDPLGYTTYQWTNSANVVVGTSRFYSATTPGLYTVKVTSTGIKGSSTSIPFMVYGQMDGVDMNYIITSIPLTEETDSAKLRISIVDKVTQTIGYFDGLGRPLQTVVTQGSPRKTDLIQPIEYDSYGREVTKYLPMAADKSGVYLDGFKPSLITFYGASNDTIANDASPFSTIVPEKTPLNRILKQGAPGTIWQPGQTNERVISYSYDFNIVSEVPLFSYSPGTGLTQNSQNSFYAPGSLNRRKTIDEHGSDVIEYTNKIGKVVVKKVQVNAGTYASTYYMYDDYQNLVCVLQPEGYKRLAAEYFSQTSSSLKEGFLKRWSFRYKYDGRNRMIEKRVPGAKPVYMVYDTRDRLVLTQDGNQRVSSTGGIKKEWTFTKYDRFNRPIITGLYVHTLNDTSQAQMQVYVNNQYGAATTFYEDFSYATGPQTGLQYGYTERCFPKASITIFTATYYDNYKFRKLISDSTNYFIKADHLTGQGVAEAESINGQTTGTWVMVLGEKRYLWTALYYDSKYRNIQNVGANYRSGIDRTTQVYDFVKLIKTYTSHYQNSQTTEANSKNIYRSLVYDHAQRLMEIWHKVNNDGSVLLVRNRYNELGELINKKIHSRNNGTSFAQTVNHEYSIRGWLTKINDITTPDVNDLFNMELRYNNPSVSGGSAQFNGNISEAIWSSSGLDKQSYSYYYDSLNRLKEAKYFNSVKPLQNGRFNEIIGGIGNRGYDLNGNIQFLKRNGRKSATTFGLMDDLTYNYSGSGNMLTSVDDVIAKNSSEEGFKEDQKIANEYTYDYNGSMKQDLNKSITKISYNYLNLPRLVWKSGADSIVYAYDATGKKLSQRVYGTSAKITDYLGEFVYEDSVLQFISHEEGRVVVDKSANPPQWEYQYFLKDHLGNVRVTFSEKKATTVYSANFETTTNTGFLNYSRVAFDLFDHTDAGTIFTYAQQLNGGYSKQVGLAKSFEVNPGDVFDLEAYGKYESTGTWSNNPQALATALVGAFGISSGGTTPLTDLHALNAFNNTFAAGSYVGRSAPYEDNTAPRAYMNYILFDANYNLLDFGFDQISVDAQQVNPTPQVAHDLLSLHVRVKEKGYLFVYLSNEQTVPTNVYFDDVKIVQTTGVEQLNDYYPFGLTFNSYQRENSVTNKIKFQGQEHIDGLNLGWDSFKWRNHMPDIGRFFNVDPLADKYVYNSPYAFSENHVTAHVELEGLEKVAINHAGLEDAFDQAASNTTTITRSGASIAVKSIDGKGGIKNSTTIDLPSSKTQAEITDKSAKTIGEVAMTANESQVKISRVATDSKGQARAMYQNLTGKGPGKGIEAQRILYGSKPGNKVIDTYVKGKAMQAMASHFGGTVSGDQIKNMMEAKINNLGVSNVTNHASTNPNINVMDVDPSSVTNQSAFVGAAQSHPGVVEFIAFPKDPGHHFEINQK